MKKILFVLSLVSLSLATPAYAVEGFYLGAEVGAVGGNNLDTQIGYGGDIGARVNALFDVMAHVQHSSHNNGINKMTSTTLSADFRVLDTGDFEIALGAGPGFYFGSSPFGSTTNFGLNYGGQVDVVLNSFIHLGVGGRFHQVFSSTDYWSATMRVGFMFGG